MRLKLWRSIRLSKWTSWALSILTSWNTVVHKNRKSIFVMIIVGKVHGRATLTPVLNYGTNTLLNHKILLLQLLGLSSALNRWNNTESCSFVISDISEFPFDFWNVFEQFFVIIIKDYIWNFFFFQLYLKGNDFIISFFIFADALYGSIYFIIEL